MNHVIAKDEWNMQARLFNRDMLQAIDLDRIRKKKKRARLPLQDAFLVRDRVLILIRDLRHLAELLLQSHLAQQIADKTRRLGIVCSGRRKRYVLLLSNRKRAVNALQQHKADAG